MSVNTLPTSWKSGLPFFYDAYKFEMAVGVKGALFLVHEVRRVQKRFAIADKLAVVGGCTSGATFVAAAELAMAGDISMAWGIVPVAILVGTVAGWSRFADRYNVASNEIQASSIKVSDYYASKDACQKASDGVKRLGYALAKLPNNEELCYSVWTELRDLGEVIGAHGQAHLELYSSLELFSSSHESSETSILKAQALEHLRAMETLADDISELADSVAQLVLLTKQVSEFRDDRVRELGSVNNVCDLKNYFGSMQDAYKELESTR